LLSQAGDLDGVRCLPSDGVAELSVFKLRGAVPERVQTTQATRSSPETKGQVRGSDEFSARTASGEHPTIDSDDGVNNLDVALPTPARTHHEQACGRQSPTRRAMPARSAVSYPTVAIRRLFRLRESPSQKAPGLRIDDGSCGPSGSGEGRNGGVRTDAAKPSAARHTEHRIDGGSKYTPRGRGSSGSRTVVT
jgi:hypothetical protein